MWAPLARLEERIDARTGRERALLGLAGAAVLAALAVTLLVEPAGRRMAAAADGLAAAQGQLGEVRAQLERAAEALAEDPDAALRLEREALLRRAERAREALADARTRLIPPAQMVQVLESLLRSAEGLDLVRVETAPARPVEGAAAPGAEGLPRVYRHGVTLSFRGTYLATLDYLERVEALPWRIFWERIELETADYPVVDVRLHAYTLGLREGWIGV
jgi:MSHA biogenesis protein MshJ